MLLGINYHYIGEDNEYPYSGIYATTPAHFRRQLEEVGNFFSFVGERDLLDALDGKKSLPERACLITFDDGVRSQYERALPILDEMNIPALFFVNGLPYGERKALSVHKTHWARAHMPSEVFWGKVQDYYAAFAGSKLDLSSLHVSEEELRKHYFYDDPYIARLKFALNKGFIPFDIREKIVHAIFSECVSDEMEFCEKFYIPSEGICDLYRRGYLGIHTYSHAPLMFLRKDAILREFNECIRVLAVVAGDKNLNIVSISYPYGNAEIIPSSVPAMARASGLRLGFTLERSFNKTLHEPLLLSRFDTNDVIGGKAPHFSVKDDGTISILHPKMTMYRHEYFEE